MKCRRIFIRSFVSLRMTEWGNPYFQGPAARFRHGALIDGEAAHEKRPVPVAQDEARIAHAAGIARLFEQRAQALAHAASLRTDAVARSSARAQEIGPYYLIFQIKSLEQVVNFSVINAFPRLDAKPELREAQAPAGDQPRSGMETLPLPFRYSRPCSRRSVRPGSSRSPYSLPRRKSSTASQRSMLRPGNSPRTTREATAGCRARSASSGRLVFELPPEKRPAQAAEIGLVPLREPCGALRRPGKAGVYLKQQRHHAVADEVSGVVVALVAAVLHMGDLVFFKIRLDLGARDMQQGPQELSPRARGMPQQPRRPLPRARLKSSVSALSSRLWAVRMRSAPKPRAVSYRKS